MKNKKQLVTSLVIVSILVISLIVGVITQLATNFFEKVKYHREYSEFVSKYSEEYGVPEYYIYALMKYQSDFVSNFESEDGRVGLCGITRENFDYMLKITREAINSDSLYGPETNIKYGTFQLFLLHTRLGKWEHVLAAFNLNIDTVDNWIKDKSNLDENDQLKEFPDSVALASGKDLLKIAERYRILYYFE